MLDLSIGRDTDYFRARFHYRQGHRLFQRSISASAGTPTISALDLSMGRDTDYFRAWFQYWPGHRLIKYFVVFLSPTAKGRTVHRRATTGSFPTFGHHPVPDSALSVCLSVCLSHLQQPNERVTHRLGRLVAGFLLYQ
jgi:hypothetical protein